MIALLILESTSTIDNVQKLLEWGFLEDLLQSALSFKNHRTLTLQIILSILSKKKESIYIMDKMSEFEFERFLDNIIQGEDGANLIFHLIRNIQRILQREF